MSDVKKCPYCAEEILAEAVKCRFCGEFLNEQLRAEKVLPSFAPPQEHKWNPGVAALLSFLIVGAGQIYKGQIGTGIVMFIGVAVCYGVGLTSDDGALQLFGLICGVLIHGVAVWNAHNAPAGSDLNPANATS